MFALFKSEELFYNPTIVQEKLAQAKEAEKTKSKQEAKDEYKKAKEAYKDKQLAKKVEKLD